MRALETGKNSFGSGRNYFSGHNLRTTDKTLIPWQRTTSQPCVCKQKQKVGTYFCLHGVKSFVSYTVAIKARIQCIMLAQPCPKAWHISAMRGQ